MNADPPAVGGASMLDALPLEAEAQSSVDSLALALGRGVDGVGDDFVRGIAFETIRQHLFGHRRTRDTIGRYQLERLLGRGGMGEVYSARDPELDRHVAIKRVLRRGAEGDDEARRLREALMRDARSAAHVQHPNVVEIYDCGAEDDELYVVMELVEGPTLEQWLDERPRSWREIVEIFVQIGQGLACAHAHGIVHRDFKPSNVLLGADGRARVADFGIARMVGDLRASRPDCETSTVESNGFAGTPQYMAPEQYEGVGVSPRADQFAYCNALYRALFHEPPFAGENLQAYAFNLLAGRVRPPMDRHGAPRGLARLVLRGLAAAPQHRHPSMDLLVARLRSILLRRRRVASAMGVAAAAICTALGGYALAHEPPISPCVASEQPWTPDERRQVHEALAQRSADEPAAVEQVVRRLDEHAHEWALARQDACEVTRVHGEQSDEVMDLRIACLARLSVPFTSVWSRLAAPDGPSGMDAAELVGQLAPASDCSAELVREQAKLAQAFSARTDRSASPEAESKWRELSARLIDARAEASMARYERAHREAVGVAEVAEQHGFRYLLADALLLQGSYGVRLAHTERQLDDARSALEHAAPLAVASGSPRLAVGAFLALAEPDARQAAPEARRMWLELAAAHATGLPAEPELAGRLALARGDLALDLEGLAEAELHYRRALALVGSDPEGVRAALGLAEALRRRGDFAGARQTLQRLREALERRGWSEPSLLAAALHNLALVALDEQAAGEAVELCEAAGRLYEASAVREEVEHQHARVTFARALRFTGQTIAARRILQGVVPALEQRGVAGRLVSMRALDELVEAQLVLGERQGAMATAERLVDVARRRHSDDHPEVARARMMLAKAARAAGSLERALAESARAHAILREGPPGLLRAEAAFRHAEAAYATGDRPTAEQLLHETIDMLEEIPGSDHAQEEVQRWADERGFDGDGSARG
jgi:tRNA A-37 threonylcarbamoyl transferase component Bud32/tetratricopeptide (TPR) repeat protein